ncbi:MAG: hypothetical protein WCA46_13730 [Actinocatenispora sp.]
MSSTVSHPKRLVAAVATAAIALLTVPLFSTPASATINHNIKRTTVTDRAMNWVKRNVQYSQAGTASDPDGNHTYRRDCSGFVSMAWHITPTGMSAPTTWTIQGHAHAIAKKNLKRGDILAWPHHHVVLFGKWANSAHTSFWLYEEANPSQDMNHRVASLSSYGSYHAWRYNHIVS